MIELIFRSLWKRNKSSLLQIIQFSVGFLAIIVLTGCFQYISEYRNKVELVMPSDVLHVCVEDEDYNNEQSTIDSEGEGERDSPDKMLTELADREFVSDIAMFEVRYVYEDNEESCDELCMLNKDSLNLANWQLQDGSIEELYDYSDEDTIPIIVSAELSLKYKCGEEYLLQENTIDDSIKRKFKVVGVIDSSMNYFTGNCNPATNQINNNDKFIIAPQFDTFNDESTYLYNVFVKLHNNSDINQLVDFCASKDKVINVKKIGDEIEEYYDSNKPFYIGLTLFAVILLLMSVIGNIGVILAGLETRYREFGIYYSLGLAQKKLIILVMGEIGYLFAVSYLIGIIFGMQLRRTGLGDIFVINSYSVIWSLCIALLCMFLCGIIPLIRMNRYEPNDLIRGIEAK